MSQAAEQEASRVGPFYFERVPLGGSPTGKFDERQMICSKSNSPEELLSLPSKSWSKVSITHQEHFEWRAKVANCANFQRTFPRNLRLDAGRCKCGDLDAVEWRLHGEQHESSLTLSLAPLVFAAFAWSKTKRRKESNRIKNGFESSSLSIIARRLVCATREARQ